MLDHLIELILRIFGQAGRSIAKEKVREQLIDFTTDNILDVAQEKLLPIDSSTDEKPSQNFQELIASMGEKGMGLLAALALVFAIGMVVLVLISDLVGKRFFFHAGNIIYAAETILVFFASLFIPAAIVGKAAPFFQKFCSLRSRGWIAFIVFIILFGIVTALISGIFPGLPEVMAKYMN